MNYFSHGIRFLHRPSFVVGSAIPDMLSVVDRKCRVRRRNIEQHLPALSGDARELALGMLQHLHDDQWFHGTPGFYSITTAVGQRFRKALGPDENWHCGFLGHVVTELLLDSALAERHPGLLGEYYRVVASVDPESVARVVSLVATQPPRELPRFLALFVQERFLDDYSDDQKLLYRLNQVMRRVGTEQLPAETVAVLGDARELVRSGIDELLPPALFSWETSPLRPE